MAVAGTRPEAIKLSPVIHMLQNLRIDTILTWSGQHYDYELSKIFFKQLELPEPVVDIDMRSGSHSQQTAKAMIHLEEAILEYKPSIVVAEGDTNSVVAAALTAMKAHIPFAHVEAGLRSYDRRMPEEINRIIADSLSELLFAPTELAVTNLTHAGIPLRKVHLTGNTIVDVVIKHKDIACRLGKDLLNKLGINSKEFLLFTLHRQENTEDLMRLSNIIHALSRLTKKHKVLFPIHPRTRNKLLSLGIYETLKMNQNLILIPPLGYFEFLGLLMHSLVVLTDSGGVQEEALTLGIPTVTLRYNTERPETTLYGMNVIAGTDPKSICKQTEDQIQKSEELTTIAKMKQNPFGDGNAGRKIAIATKNALEAGIEVETSDTRHDPYVTYKLVNPNKLRQLSMDGVEIMAIYNKAGYSQQTLKNKNLEIANGKILIRAPSKVIKKFFKEN